MPVPVPSISCILSFNPTHMKEAALCFIGWRSGLPKVEAWDHYYMLNHMSHLVDSQRRRSVPIPFRDSSVPNMAGLAQSRNS